MNKLMYIGLTLSVCLSFTVQAKTFKISTSTPDGSYWMNQMRDGAKKIKELTNSRVNFKFYPGGVMGSNEVVMKKVRINQLQGAAVSSGILASYYPESQIYGLPMLFNNYGEVDHVRKKYDKEIIEGLKKAGMISFGLSEAGFTYAMSTKAIYTTDDLLSNKIWTPTNNKQAELTLHSFGVAPIPLSIGDVLAGLQTRLIDTVAVSPIVAIALQWHTQIKYITEIPLTYVYATLIVDKNSFDKISKDDQKIVMDIMNEVFERINTKNREDNLMALNVLSSQGIEIIKPEEEALNLWHKKGEEARNIIKAKDLMSKRTIEDVSKLLTEFRKKDELLGATR